MGGVFALVSINSGIFQHFPSFHESLLQYTPALPLGSRVHPISRKFAEFLLNSPGHSFLYFEVKRVRLVVCELSAPQFEGLEPVLQRIEQSLVVRTRFGLKVYPRQKLLHAVPVGFDKRGSVFLVLLSQRNSVVDVSCQSLILFEWILLMKCAQLVAHLDAKHAKIASVGLLLHPFALD